MDAKTLRVSIRKFWREEFRSLLILALLMFSIRSSLADWNPVPTGSMKPTILEGDCVFVNKLAYDLKIPFTTLHLAEWGAPRRGDIVVFYSPKDGMRLIKRAVGLPGDMVELRDDQLIINGSPVEYKSIDEELLRDVTANDRASSVYATEELPGREHMVAGIPNAPAMRSFGPSRVPENCYFMMGDNRDNSADSRYIGAVQRNRILGRATGIIVSLDPQHYRLPRWDRFFSPLDHDSK